ncbi:MAG: SDR family NAD(P)-dependent oxidoreductase [Chloroflexi bacterium]|nr:SDR family NAD(P)-dependent oxidoreductase [Chloroflexota bacterium]
MTSPFIAKTIVVTGATSGIGLATAEELVRQGADVIGVGRSAQRCRGAEQRLRSLNPAANVIYCTADLTLQSEVRRLAETIRQITAGRGRAAVDGLVNNAGAFTYWLTLTPEGFETQWALHHLAPFLLTQELLPLLQAAPAGRIVTVSSGSHYNTNLNWTDIQLRRSYNGLQAYKQTKLANVLFTAELNRRLGARSGVRAFAADPGLVNTEIGLKGTPGLVQWIWERRRAAGIPAAEAARGIIFLLGEAAIQDTRDLYWKHGKPQSPSRQALDRPAAERLWALSERMCGAVVRG